MHRKAPLTKEQRDWLADLKIVRKKQVYSNLEMHEKPIHETIFYIKNCAFWMNEYVEGRVDKERLIKSMCSMKMNLKKLEELVLLTTEKTEK